MERMGINATFNYEKISNQRAGKKLAENYKDLLNYDLNVLVYNFVDMLSHSRTEMEMIRELAFDESSYRSLVHSWFQHSYLYELLKLLKEQDITLVITTDHESHNTPGKPINVYRGVLIRSRPPVSKLSIGISAPAFHTTRSEQYAAMIGAPSYSNRPLFERS